VDHKPDTLLARNGELPGIVAQLGERFAIMELVTTAVTYGDHREWERLAACYAEQVTVDYTETLGGTAKQVARDVLMPYWQSLLVAFDATQHAVSNVDVRLDGDSATTRSHVIATHRIEKDVWVCGGVFLLSRSRAFAQRLAHQCPANDASLRDGRPYRVRTGRRPCQAGTRLVVMGTVG
jgi:hypothetical protein